MTGPDARVLDDVAVERLLTRGESSPDPALAAAVAELRMLAEGPAPLPTPALAELLGQGFEPAVVPFRRPRATQGRQAIRAGTAALAVAASILAAGSAAALPPAMQDTVADLVAALTPFDLPRATPEVTLRPARPVPVPAGDVAPPQVPGPIPVESPVPAPAVPSSAEPAAPAAPAVGRGVPPSGRAGAGVPASEGPTAVTGQERDPRPVEEPQAVERPATAAQDSTSGREAAPAAPEREPAGAPRP